MTNAEKIRQMTDEELAYLLMPGDYVACPVHLLGGRDCRESCCECALEWLREEIDDYENKAV